MERTTKAQEYKTISFLALKEKKQQLADTLIQLIRLHY